MHYFMKFLIFPILHQCDISVSLIKNRIGILYLGHIILRDN